MLFIYLSIFLWLFGNIIYLLIFLFEIGSPPNVGFALTTQRSRVARSAWLSQPDPAPYLFLNWFWNNF